MFLHFFKYKSSSLVIGNAGGIASYIIFRYIFSTIYVEEISLLTDIYCVILYAAAGAAMALIFYLKSLEKRRYSAGFAKICIEHFDSDNKSEQCLVSLQAEIDDIDKQIDDVFYYMKPFSDAGEYIYNKIMQLYS